MALASLPATKAALCRGQGPLFPSLNAPLLAQLMENRPVPLDPSWGGLLCGKAYPERPAHCGVCPASRSPVPSDLSVPPRPLGGGQCRLL